MSSQKGQPSVALSKEEREEIASIRMALLSLAASEVSLRAVLLEILNDSNVALEEGARERASQSILESVSKIKDFLEHLEKIKF